MNNGKRKHRYEPISDTVKSELRELQKPSLLQSLIAFGTDWGSVVLAVLLSENALQSGVATWIKVLIVALALGVIGNRQRALECLVHEGTHGNIDRKRKRNDLLVWLFAALPLGHHLNQERKGHCSGHHASYWKKDIDPDRMRYESMGVIDLPVTRYRNVFIKFAKAFPAYYVGAVKTFLLPDGESTPSLLGRLLYWSMIVGLTAMTGTFHILLVYWLIPFLTVLMVLRFFGESTEHTGFENYDNELISTRNNIGLINDIVLHPHGDGYHIVHHLYPSIPFYNLKKAHYILMQDQTYREIGCHCDNPFFGDASTLRSLVNEGND